MRFFTPDLYVRFNSRNDEEADEAYQEWEVAAARYTQYLDTFRDRLTTQVRKLTELALHDAQILARIEEIQAVAQPFFQKESLTILLPTWSAVGIVTVKDEGQIRSLIYCLCDRIRIQPPPESWPFSAQGEHWLSDELELVTSQLGAALPGTFLHRILLSSGIVMEIPFTSVIVHEFSLVGIPQEV